MEWSKGKSGLFIPSQRLELPQKHHSLSDWDFRAGVTYALDNSIYVSSPSSLRIITPGTSGYYVLCLNRDSACLNLPQGRIETQWQSNFSGIRPEIEFRNQGALGSIDESNRYYISITTGGASIYKVIAGVTTSLGSWAAPGHSSAVWYRERCTWWNEAPVFLIRYEYWNGSAWIIAGTDITDASPSFGASATNRCGLGFRRTASSYYLYYDNTMIYGPA